MRKIWIDYRGRFYYVFLESEKSFRIKVGKIQKIRVFIIINIDLKEIKNFEFLKYSRKI